MEANQKMSERIHPLFKRFELDAIDAYCEKYGCIRAEVVRAAVTYFLGLNVLPPVINQDVK